MKQTRITLVALALVLAASVAGAQQSDTARANRPHAGQRAGRHGQQHAQGAKRAKEARGQRRHGEQRALRAALRGVQLTDAQKAQVKAIAARYRTESQPIVQRLRPAMQEAKRLRQQGDTAGARAALQKSDADRQALRALAERRKAEVLAILTPEQRAKVDADVAQRKAKADARKAKLEQRKAGKAQRKARQG